MKSEVNLTIEIEHDEQLGLDAAGIADEIAKHVSSTLGLSEGRLVVRDDRNHICGPVRVYLRSAFIVNPAPRVAT